MRRWLAILLLAFTAPMAAIGSVQLASLVVGGPDTLAVSPVLTLLIAASVLYGIASVLGWFLGWAFLARTTTRSPNPPRPRLAQAALLALFLLVAGSLSWVEFGPVKTF